MPAVAQRLAPRVPSLDVEIAHDPALFARIAAVWRARFESALDAEQIRLVDVVRGRMAKADAEMSHWAEYDYVIVNYDLDQSLTMVESILLGERLRRRRQIGLSEVVKEMMREG